MTKACSVHLEDHRLPLVIYLVEVSISVGFIIKKHLV
ncbi:hypothetical protein THAOC_00593, partial [Thalassiosira oceanica]